MNRAVARKARLVERVNNLTEGQQSIEHELLTQTIKSGLDGMLRDGPDKQLIKDRIEEDVKEISGLAVEFSHYIHFIVYRQLESAEDMIDLDFRELIDHLTVKFLGGKFVPKGNLDPEYKEIRERFGLRKLYDARYRTQLIQKIADQYRTNFTTNLTYHSYTRVRRCLRVLNKNSRNLEARLKDSLDFLFDSSSIVNNSLRFPEGCAWTRGCLKDSQKASKCLEFLKDFYRMQKEFERRSVKSFVLVPLYKAGRKHLSYDKRAFLGLIGAIGRVPKGMNDTSKFQNLYEFNTHFNLIKGKTMGASFSTDGVAICMQYEKLGIKKPSESKEEKKKKKKEKDKNVCQLPRVEDYHRFIGIDPGLRLFIAATELEHADEGAPFRPIKYSSQQYHKDAGFGRRRHKLRNWTGELDGKIEANRRLDVERIQALLDAQREEEREENEDADGSTGGESDGESGQLRESDESSDSEKSSEDEENSIGKDEEDSSGDEEEQSDDEDEEFPTHLNARIEKKSPTFFRDFLNFRLKWMKRKMKKYLQRKVARLHLDKHMKTNSTLSHFIKDNFVLEPFDSARNRNMYAVLLGDARMAPNSPMKGYRRVPNALLVKKLKENRNIHVYFIDEYLTTKLCSRCYKELVVSDSPHRYSVCHNCRSVWNRDINASNSIAKLGIQELRGERRQREFDRSAAKRKARTIVS